MQIYFTIMRTNFVLVSVEAQLQLDVPAGVREDLLRTRSQTETDLESVTAAAVPRCGL